MKNLPRAVIDSLAIFSIKACRFPMVSCSFLFIENILFRLVDCERNLIKQLVAFAVKETDNVGP